MKTELNKRQVEGNVNSRLYSNELLLFCRSGLHEEYDAGEQS